MIEVANFQDWASQCADFGWKGPFKLYGKPRDSYQFISEKGGTEAMWNGEAGRGFIFMKWADAANEGSPSSDTGKPV